MIYKSHANKAGRRRARMEKVVDPDPLSSVPGSGADVVNSGAGVVDPLSGPGS